MKRATGALRVAILALSSLTCALASGLVALQFHASALPPSDGAHGPSVWALLADPVVWPVFLFATLGLGVLGFLAALVTLWQVNLAKAIPFVSFVTVGATAAAEYAHIVFGPYLALGAALLAMQWCRSVFRWVVPRPPEPSVFRTGLRSLSGPMRQGPQ